MKNGLGSLRNETVLFKRLEALLHRCQHDHRDYTFVPAPVVIEIGVDFSYFFNRGVCSGCFVKESLENQTILV